jgi:hypothetical protein
MQAFLSQLHSAAQRGVLRGDAGGSGQAACRGDDAQQQAACAEARGGAGVVNAGVAAALYLCYLRAGLGRDVIIRV